MATVGFTIGGAGIGAVLGAYWADWRSTGDYDFSMLFYVPMGGLLGAVLGCVAGVSAFG